jgi:hypothetical protein
MIKRAVGFLEIRPTALFLDIFQTKVMAKTHMK